MSASARRFRRQQPAPLASVRIHIDRVRHHLCARADERLAEHGTGGANLAAEIGREHIGHLAPYLDGGGTIGGEALARLWLAMSVLADGVMAALEEQWSGGVRELQGARIPIERLRHWLTKRVAEEPAPAALREELVELVESIVEEELVPNADATGTIDGGSLVEFAVKTKIVSDGYQAAAREAMGAE